MKFRSNPRTFAAKAGEAPVGSDLVATLREEVECEDESTLIKTVGWISAGLGAVALGLFIGREVRQRYKFNRRTPYDFYSHSGDEHDVDFGIGV
jgi:hypothetical protein